MPHPEASYYICTLYITYVVPQSCTKTNMYVLHNYLLILHLHTPACTGQGYNDHLLAEEPRRIQPPSSQWRHGCLWKPAWVQVGPPMALQRQTITDSYIRNSIVLGACSFILHVCAYWCCITLHNIDMCMCSHISKLSYCPVLQYAKMERGGLAHFNTKGMSVSAEVDRGRKGPSKGSWNPSVQVLEALLIRKKLMCQTVPLFLEYCKWSNWMVGRSGNKAWTVSIAIPTSQWL